MSDAVRLSWHGPLMLGNFPETEEELARLRYAGVYVFFRYYTQHPLVYVGKSENLAERFSTHIADSISGKVGQLFDHDGTLFRNGGLATLFRSLQREFEDTLHHGVEDARRTRLIYTLLPDRQHRVAIEATIIGRLLERRKLPDKFTVWNSNRHRSLEMSAVLEHDQSMVDTASLTAEERDEMQIILDACRTPT